MTVAASTVGLEQLRRSLPGVTTGAHGDCLAIHLVSYFEPDIESEEMSDCGTWKQGAVDAANAVMDAVHAHYAPTIAALTHESLAATSAEAEIHRLRSGYVTLRDAAALALALAAGPNAESVAEFLASIHRHAVAHLAAPVAGGEAP